MVQIQTALERRMHYRTRTDQYSVSLPLGVVRELQWRKGDALLLSNVGDGYLVRKISDEAELHALRKHHLIIKLQGDLRRNEYSIYFPKTMVRLHAWTSDTVFEISDAAGGILLRVKRG